MLVLSLQVGLLVVVGAITNPLFKCILQQLWLGALGEYVNLFTQHASTSHVSEDWLYLLIISILSKGWSVNTRLQAVG
jgi:hypothetical protein